MAVIIDYKTARRRMEKHNAHKKMQKGIDVIGKLKNTEITPEMAFILTLLLLGLFIGYAENLVPLLSSK
ncbi:hypothetical protein [Thermotalea metallivorans]|uniref:Uncharacterized protein n=1 Tax=Thermotalea metallivorans TaxID=520762 RepID=A0A140LAI9_9FIRM|nr:hypothetical protein [Thermotalea metallivorans]KXG77564.1 hypothetical protein AN619_04170 [Thermotalea metallivorans]